MIRTALLFTLGVLMGCGNSTAPPPSDAPAVVGDATCFPPPSCDGPQRCTGTRTYEQVESRPCGEVCGRQPCVGSTCVAVSGERVCPAGTRCVAYRPNDPRGFNSPTPCQPLTDGGG